MRDSMTITFRFMFPRDPDGQDTNNAASDWVFTQTKTPGAANVASP